MPQSDWRDTLDHLDVAAYYRSEGIEIRSGKALCPFHEDSTPSLSIDQHKGMFNCHACGASGSVFDFYARKHAVNFSAAANALATFTGSTTSEPTVAVPRPPTTFSEGTIRKWWANLRRSPEHLRYLHEKRGINDDTIDSEFLGWTGSRYSIPIRDKDGVITNAKLYDPKASGGDKMIWAVSGSSASLFVPLATRAIHEDHTAVVVEGEFDALLGAQHGVACYSGTAGARTWKKEWNDALPAQVTILYDSDESGDSGSAQAAASLVGSGKDVLLARWAAGVAHGYDLTDYLVGGHTAADLAGDVLSGAVRVAAPSQPATPVSEGHAPEARTTESLLTFAEAPRMLALIDPATGPIDVMHTMRKYLPAMARWAEAEVRLFYEDTFATHFKKNLRRHHVRALLKEVLDYRREQARKKATLLPTGEDVDVLSDFKHMGLGQHYQDDKMYYTVTQGIIVTEVLPDYTEVERPEFRAVFVSPNGLMLTDKTELAKDKFYLNGSKPIIDFNESWQFDPTAPFSWSWYLKHRTDKEELDVAELYASIREAISTYVYVADDEMYDVLTCYVMLSYVFRVFRSVGYLWLRAYRGSGKSTVLNILNVLGFNAMKVIDTSTSSLFRRISATSPLMLIDEAEKYTDTKKTSENMGALLGLMKGGYQAGNLIWRTEMTSNGEANLMQFDPFGPKVFASIADIDETLADRCITYDMQRATKVMPDFPSDRARPRWVAMRNRLHCFGMFYAPEVAAYAEMTNLTDEGKSQSVYGDRMMDLRNRDREVWRPILTIALLVGQHQPTPNTDLFERLLTYSKSTVLAKQRATTEDYEFQAVMAVRRFIRENKTSDGWYASTDLLKYIRSVEGQSDHYSAKRLNTMLTNKLKVCGSLDHGLRGAKRTAHFHIDLPLLEAKCKALSLEDEDVLSFKAGTEIPITVRTQPESGNDEPPDEMERAARSLWGEPE